MGMGIAMGMAIHTHTHTHRYPHSQPMVQGHIHADAYLPHPFEPDYSSPTPTMSIQAQLLMSHLHHIISSLIAHLPPLSSMSIQAQWLPSHPHVLSSPIGHLPDDNNNNVMSMQDKDNVCFLVEFDTYCRVCIRYKILLSFYNT